MKLIPIDRLHPHPDNSNRMPTKLFEKLVAHLRTSNQYPPLIVRQLPGREDHFQIMDGHHRARALERIGHREASCDVWEVDDERATVLLLTLNRLQGEDDPALRGRLLQRLARDRDVRSVAALVPDAQRQIEKLIALSGPPSPPATSCSVDDLPRAITFFLNARVHEALRNKLQAVSHDRNRALVALLDLE